MSKVAIVGAGTVGSTIAYAAMIRGLVQELVLIDSNAEKARAQAMDLNHGAMFVPKVRIQNGGLEDCRGADVIVVTAGAKQKPGQSRLDLVNANAVLFHELIPRLTEQVPDAHLLIVSNPVDVLTELALRLSGLPPARVLGSGTVLDTSRFRFLLAEHFRVSPSNVHAYIIGEHGDSELPLWSSAQIGNVPLEDVALPGRNRLDDARKQRIFEDVRSAAGEVIRAKGATNWAIGLCVADILEALLRNEGVVLTVSRRLEGVHGVEGLCLSVPWVVTRQGAESCLVPPCNASECEAFRQSASVVKGVLEQIGT